MPEREDENVPDQAKADTVITSARLWDGRHLDAEAIAIRDGRILATGTDRDIGALVGESTRSIDAGGRRLIPGLIDSHLHLVRGGRTWADEVRWDDATSLEEALELLAAKAADLGAGRWVGVMGGWHPHQFEEGRAPTKADLDRACPDNPAFVQRAYAESFANSRAVAEMGWDPGSDGHVVAPPEMAALRAKLAVEDVDHAATGTRLLLRELNRLGLTGAIDASGFGVTAASYDAFQRVFDEGGAGFRARFLLGAATPGAEMDDIRRWVSSATLGTPDGMLGNLGAGEVLDYAAHDLEGLEPKDITARTAALAEASAFLAEHGWTVHLHSILDTSLTILLDAWESIDADIAALRFCICHADQIGPENLRRVADLGVGITIQNGMSMRGIDCLPTWGEETVTAAPPVRSMLDLGIPVAAGTDGTVACTYDPWRCISWLVTGRSVDGAPPRREEQRLTRDEALTLYTSAGAWCSFEEDTRGNLRVGSYADLALLDGDPLTVGEEHLSGIQSVLTVVDGSIVHSDLPGVETR